MTDQKITLRANAKINLFLDITGKRPDGYHTISGVMHAVGLWDDVTVALSPRAEGEDAIRLTCSRPDLPTDRGNLGYRAAEAFLQAIGKGTDAEFGVYIHIEKRIPAAAGLAGGSTDAAAVLRGLNLLLGQPLCVEELCRVGLTLGADVPFCIVGGTQMTCGVGEELTPVRSLPACSMVIACGGEGVSTPGAYRALDQLFEDFDGRLYRPREEGLARLIQGLEREDMEEISNSVYNIFEYVVLPRHSVALPIKRIMEEHGARVALMSGSGPSVFGIFFNPEAAESAAKALAERDVPAWICQN